MLAWLFGRVIPFSEGGFLPRLTPALFKGKQMERVGIKYIIHKASASLSLKVSPLRS